MDKARQVVALTLVGCLGLLALGWFLLISPKRSEAAEVRAQSAGQESANQALELRLQVLKSQAEALPKKQAQLAGLAVKVPERADLPTLIRALTAAAGAAGVELESITPSAPVLATPEAPAAPPIPADPAAPEGGVIPPAAAPAAPGGPQLATVPLSIGVKGSYFAIVQFLTELEEMPRALRLTNLGMAPVAAGADGADGRTLSATLTGEVFMSVGPAAGSQPAPGAAVAAPIPAAQGAPANAGGEK